ncbi:MAG: type VI secretion system tube protein Hcp [Planctomycetota bacterium]
MIEMYLEFEGIVGSESRKGVKDALPVLAWSWGLSGSPTRHPNVQDLSVTLWMDAAATGLARAITEHSSGKARLSCFRPRDEEHPLYRYELEGAAVTSLSMGGSGGEDRFTLNTSITFKAISMQINLLDAEGRTTPEFASAQVEVHDSRW